MLDRGLQLRPYNEFNSCTIWYSKKCPENRVAGWSYYPAIGTLNKEKKICSFKMCPRETGVPKNGAVRLHGSTVAIYH